MKFILFLPLILVPALLMSLVLWLVVKKTKVEGSFWQFFLISIIVSLATLFPIAKNFIAVAVLFVLLWKWEDIKFWSKVKFWPDSLIVLVAGWGAFYAANYLLFKMFTLLK